MEGVLNFCLGCLFFGFGIQFGLFPATLYCQHVSEFADTNFMWKDWNKARVNFPQPETLSKFAPLTVQATASENCAETS